MAKTSGNLLTKYTSASTIVTANVANTWYGGLYGTPEGTLYEAGDPVIAGHVHDGQHLDGHAQKIDLVEHVTNQLRNPNIADDAITHRNIEGFIDQQAAIPEYEIIDGYTYYYLDLSDLRDEISQIPSPFITEENVTSNSPGDLELDDFVFGSDSLDNDGYSTYYSRFLFDKSKSAFRAGYADSDEWDESNRGDYSAAFGKNNKATSNYSFVGAGSSNYVLANSYASFIGAGGGNKIDNGSEQAFIGAGANVEILASDYGFVGAGFGNSMDGSQRSAIVVGNDNYIDSSALAMIGAGQSNEIIETSDYSFIGSGSSGSISNGSLGAFIGAGGLTSAGASNPNSISESNSSSIVSGEGNQITAGFSNSIVAGKNNQIFGVTQLANIIGSGVGNIIEETETSTIASGGSNYINNCSNSGIVSGSECQIDDSSASFVGSGYQNTITVDSEFSGIVSGYQNSIEESTHSVIGGGSSNSIQESKGSFIGAGGIDKVGLDVGNSITSAGNSNAIIAGYQNSISSTGHSNGIFSGVNNQITGTNIDQSFIGAGTENLIQGTNKESSAILCGESNIIDSSAHSSILNGMENKIEDTAQYALAYGKNAVARSHAERAFSSGQFLSINGSSQEVTYIFFAEINGDGLEDEFHLYLDGSGEEVVMTISSYLHLNCQMLIVNDAETIVYAQTKNMVVKGAGTPTSHFSGSPLVEEIDPDGDTSAPWTIDIASDTSGRWHIKLTASAAPASSTSRYVNCICRGNWVKIK
jgi:hypothetical protein